MVSLGVFYKKRVGYSSDIDEANDYMYDMSEFEKGKSYSIYLIMYVPGMHLIIIV